MIDKIISILIASILIASVIIVVPILTVFIVDIMTVTIGVRTTCNILAIIVTASLVLLVTLITEWSRD